MHPRVQKRQPWYICGMKKYVFIVAIVFFGCRPANKLSRSNPGSISIEGRLFASLYQQRAAEYRALCYQAYNLARLRLDEAILKTYAKPLAIVTDIDETVLDNSPYDVKQSLQGKEYEQKSWEQWTALSQADTVAGGLSFLKYAASKGIKVFYITNRNETERKGTLTNLQKFGFPDAVDEHLILKGTTSSKEARRLAVAQKYEIIMFMGDNLADFSVLFDKKNYTDRLANTDAASADFGKRFIVLPNPVYGDWEAALFNYNYGLSLAQKDSIFKTVLRSY